MPWTNSKCQDGFCPIASWIVSPDEVDIKKTRMFLKLNGETKQDGTTADMIFSIAEILSVVSHRMTLYEGDIILTGTPAGIGPLSPGDECVYGISTKDGKECSASFTVKSAKEKGSREK
eukprot:Trichotokara_eunicae@DN2374_c0_g1_i1.p1